jgi:hypothetical protein
MFMVVYDFGNVLLMYLAFFLAGHNEGAKT